MPDSAWDQLSFTKARPSAAELDDGISAEVVAVGVASGMEVGAVRFCMVLGAMKTMELALVPVTLVAV